MKKIYTFFLVTLATLMPLAAWALPFVPTTNPQLSSTYWYQLRTGSIYAYASSDYYSELLPSTTASTDDHYLWCFVGNETTGYKVFNKATQQYLTGVYFGSADDRSVVYYEAASGDSFYLIYTNDSPGFYNKYYVMYNSSYGMFICDAIKGTPYTAIEVIQGTEPLNCTRYDSDGVGYAFVEGGLSLNNSEIASNICDGKANTKFFAASDNFYVIVQAEKSVAVKQYSLVTANDSRGQYNRMPRSWKLQGSNDKTNWTDIDARTDYPMPFADQQEVVFAVNDQRLFTYFKLQMTAQSANGFVQLGEFWINEQRHDWGAPTVTIEPTCGTPGAARRQCSDCNAFDHEVVAATNDHNYNDGLCTVCGAEEGETVLLHNGQTAPYFASAYHGYRDSNDAWPAPPQWWNTTDYDDSRWMRVMMPIASVDHSDGPFIVPMYNSYWYGEYNCYWFRRQFTMPSVDPNASYLLRFVHDDNMVVYLNGQEVARKDGWSETPSESTWENWSEEVEVPASAFRTGKNVLAVYIQQNWGGAYFDCSLTQHVQKQSITGDVTGDGKVDVDDINAIINIITGKAEAGNYSGNADLTGDNKIDVDDINRLINIILGKES